MIKTQANCQPIKRLRCPLRKGCCRFLTWANIENWANSETHLISLSKIDRQDRALAQFSNSCQSSTNFYFEQNLSQYSNYMAGFLSLTSLEQALVILNE